jgi:Pregnancy-associated plasma protein-A/Secretion system C-terminal sorting domain
MKNIKIKLLFMMLIFQIGIAQQRTCGMEDKMIRINSNPFLKQKYLGQQLKFRSKLHEVFTDQKKNANLVIRIPVAVHFPEGNNNDRACLVALAQSQVNVLNEDYNATNADISNWVSAKRFYSGITTSNFEIHFELATKSHPENTDPSLLNGDPAVTVAYNFGLNGDSDAAWSGYLNFVVKDLGGSLLGYSPVGGLVFDGDAVVMDNNAFGRGGGCTDFTPRSPFNLGRTVTHELGHFFNLYHTFGNNDGCLATNTDYINDTPKVGNASYGCPTSGSVPGCDVLPALTMNYMDYVDDSCMYMFTLGQKNVAKAYLQTLVPDFKKDVFIGEDYVKPPFSVYPNPNNGDFAIQFENYSPEHLIDIYDVSGRNVFSKKINPGGNNVKIKIQMAKMVNGFYYVSIKNDKMIKTQKIFIQNE